jgi:hypothetical protein
MSSDLDSILEPQFDYVNNLPDSIKDALFEYTDTAYRDLNDQLRSGSVLTSSQRRLLDLIDRAFDAVPPTDQPIIVYRGVRGSFLPDIVAYVSTTYDPDVAKSFTGSACCYLKIVLPAGSLLLPIEWLSNSPHEHEILLPRDGKFMITHTRWDESVGVQAYDVIYIPENSQPLDETTNLTETGPPSVDLAQWVQRIVDLISPEELDLLGPADAVNSVVTTSLKSEAIPSEAIQMAIQRLSNQVPP